jgi:hypothetical protein
MKQKRGIALITVLMIAVVMMILLGSFVKVNQQRFGILNNDLHHVAASEAARSAFDYCLYRLERNRNWGAAEFPGNEDSAVAETLQVKTVAGTFQVQGKVLESGAEFEVEVLNNIDRTPNVTIDGVQAGHCRLRITARRGAAQTTREALLNTAPLFDGSVVASDGITIDAEQLAVSSTDPMRNRLRSKAQIEVPDYQTSFQFRPAENATEQGVLWAMDGITSGGKDLSDLDIALEAAQKTGGRFLPNADTHHDVYDLQMSEIKTNKKNVSVDSGVYVFRRRTVGYDGNSGRETKVVPVLERRDWALDQDGHFDGGDVREVWFLDASLPQDQWGDRLKLFNDLPEAGLHAMKSNSFPLDDGVQVNFNSLDPEYRDTNQQSLPPSIVIDSRLNLNVQGDFGVTSNNKKFYPTIKFQDPRTDEVDGGDIEGKGAQGILDAQSGDGTTSGSITTHRNGKRPGSIYIAGAISGSGKLLAEGDVTLRNTFANVSASEQSDLSIYAGGSVALRPQKARKLDGRTIFGESSSDVQGITQFKGLIFAKDDVLIQADKNTDERFIEKSDVFIEGAVVARNGSVTVKNARNVNFKYNPNYLDAILNRNSNARVRLERVVWKEI